MNIFRDSEVLPQAQAWGMSFTMGIFFTGLGLSGGIIVFALLLHILR